MPFTRWTLYDKPIEWMVNSIPTFIDSAGMNDRLGAVMVISQVRLGHRTREIPGDLVGGRRSRRLNLPSRAHDRKEQKNDDQADNIFSHGNPPERLIPFA